MKKIWPIIIAIIVIAAGAIWFSRGYITQKAFEPNDTVTAPAQEEPPINNGNDSENTAPVAQGPEIVAQNLTVPWEIAFLPDGDMLVTERGGTLKRFGNSPASFPISDVRQMGEGGLLGLTIHPNFNQNNFIYLYFTTANATNKVVRYRFQNNQLTADRTIIENIPGASNHDGGRIAFGPDNLLYITTGDAQQTSLAQNTNSLAGKILRLTDDGGIPQDNPFNNAVYSYGHRNPQGLAWDPQGRLWSTEHGRSGVSTGLDEVNLITPGTNYGWPTIAGDQTREGMQPPKAHSGPNTTWAPSGMAIYNNTIYFAGLRGQSLYQATISGDNLGQVTSRFASQYGRLRAVTVHGGWLYFSTSNRDGRGQIQTNDDKIIRIRL